MARHGPPIRFYFIVICKGNKILPWVPGEDGNGGSDEDGGDGAVTPQLTAVQHRGDDVVETQALEHCIQLILHLRWGFGIGLNGGRGHREQVQSL